MPHFIQSGHQPVPALCTDAVVPYSTVHNQLILNFANSSERTYERNSMDVFAKLVISTCCAKLIILLQSLAFTIMVKVVIVCTSASDLKGHATGVWVEELAAPYYIFNKAGYEVDIASPSGGPIPIDATSMGEEFFTAPSQKFMHDPAGIGALSHSVKVDAIDWSNVDCIYLTGGHGTCVDFLDNPTLKEAVEKMYASNKIVATVCHGPIGLCECNTPDGKPLVAGKTVTGFADSEEVAVNLQHLVPFLLESKLKELGAKYEKVDDWHSKVCVDGKLVTGQNPQSSEENAKMVVKMLS